MNGENVPRVETIEVVLIHCNIANNDYQQDSKVLYLFPINRFVSEKIFHQKILFLRKALAQNLYKVKCDLLIKF